MNWFKNLVVPPWLAPLLIGAVVLGVMWKSYFLGEDHAQAICEKTQLEDTIKLLDENSKLLQEKRALEQARNESQQATINYFTEQANHAQDQKTSAINAVRAGHQRLYVHTKQAPSTTDKQAGGGTAALALVSDAETRAELSDEDAEFLVGLAAEADQVTLQLNACQDLLKQSRASREQLAVEQALRNEGYTHIDVQPNDPNLCLPRDIYRNKFTATAPNGVAVQGMACGVNSVATQSIQAVLPVVLTQ